MATTNKEKQVAKEVLLRFAERGVREFSESIYKEIADPILREKGYRFAEGRRCQIRRIRPLVERGFDNKFRRAQEEMKKRASEPPVMPEESKLGESRDSIQAAMLAEVEKKRHDEEYWRMHKNLHYDTHPV